MLKQTQLKKFWRLQLMSPAAVGMALLLSSPAVAIAPEADNSKELNPSEINSELKESQRSGAETVNTVDNNNSVQVPAIAVQEPVEEDALKVDSKKTSEASINNTLDELEELTASARSNNNAASINSSVNDLDELEELTRSAQSDIAGELELAQTNPTQQDLPSNNEVLEQINRYGTEETNGSLGQNVPGAAQFTDVSPNDWAFQALDDLVRRYDCLKGYPDSSYRGNRSLSRYEFAAGLNACLQQIERLIAASTADFVTRADLEALQRLIQEFEAELATLGTRVDNLEGRVAFLEDHQFSTTTKLSGEVIMALTNDFSSDDDISSTVSSVGQAAFGDRVRLELNTSFSGQDRLVTRLSAGNLSPFTTSGLADDNGDAIDANAFSNSTLQTFNIGENDNDVEIDWLAYYFQYGNSQAYLAATGGNWSDIVPTLNPYFEDFDGGNGSISTFAQRNPIFRIGGGSGAALSFGFTPIESILGPSTLTIGYLAGNASQPGAGSGLFNGDYAILGNLNANVSDNFGLGLTYVHGYHSSGSPIFGEGSTDNALDNVVGSYVANNPWRLLDTSGTVTPMVSNSYGAQFALRPSSSFVVNGSITWTDVTMLQRGDADVWTYALGVAFPDLGKEGNVLGLYGGMQPTLRGIRALDVNDGIRRIDDVWHVEGFYKYQLTENISITPGVIWIMNPNQNVNNSSSIIGTLRTTFSF